MSTEAIGMIDVTGVPLDALVRAAYSPSRQQGLRLYDLSGREGGLSDEEVAEIVSRGEDDSRQAISIDYLWGRSVKFHVKRLDGRHYIPNRWYDHSDDELRALLEGVGLSGDLIEKARSERTAYEDKCLGEAIDYLKAAGGSVVQNRLGRAGDYPIPAQVDTGFWVGRERGVIREEWLGAGNSKWMLTDDIPSNDDFSAADADKDRV